MKNGFLIKQGMYNTQKNYGKITKISSPDILSLSIRRI